MSKPNSIDDIDLDQLDLFDDDEIDLTMPDDESLEEFLSRQEQIDPPARIPEHVSYR